MLLCLRDVNKSTFLQSACRYFFVSKVTIKDAKYRSGDCPFNSLFIGLAALKNLTYGQLLPFLDQTKLTQDEDKFQNLWKDPTARGQIGCNST